MLLSGSKREDTDIRKKQKIITDFSLSVALVASFFLQFRLNFAFWGNKLSNYI